MANNDTVEITLYNDGISGQSMPLTINGESVIGNAGPLEYIKRLETGLHALKPDLQFNAAIQNGWLIKNQPCKWRMVLFGALIKCYL